MAGNYWQLMATGGESIVFKNVVKEKLPMLQYMVQHTFTSGQQKVYSVGFKTEHMKLERSCGDTGEKPKQRELEVGR